MLSQVLEHGRLDVRADFAPGDCCAINIITVGTPLGEDGKARLDMIENAASQVAAAMPHDSLVILRSTVKIGTSRAVVEPILRASGKRFEIAMCPERTIEGKALEELRELPQIVGADRLETRERAARLFSRLTPNILPVSSPEAAETIKLSDNVFRDVSFAFANEIARLCDAVGVSAQEVIATGKFGYPRTRIPLPGLVGGPCLEKDGHILRQSAIDHGIELEITTAGRLVNERQPRECAAVISAELDRRGFTADAVVTLCGLAFKGTPETDDLRGSMAVKVLNELVTLRPQARWRLYDPVVAPDALQAVLPGAKVAGSIDAAGDGAAALVITNNHPSFSSLGLTALTRPLAPRGFVYDFWSHYPSPATGDREPSYVVLGSMKRVSR